MTSAIRKLAEAVARRTTKAQGLPLRIDDPRTVGKLAEMFGPILTSQSDGPRVHHVRGPSATSAKGLPRDGDYRPHETAAS